MVVDWLWMNVGEAISRASLRFHLFEHAGIAERNRQQSSALARGSQTPSSKKNAALGRHHREVAYGRSEAETIVVDDRGRTATRPGHPDGDLGSDASATVSVHGRSALVRVSRSRRTAPDPKLSAFTGNTSNRCWCTRPRDGVGRLESERSLQGCDSTGPETSPNLRDLAARIICLHRATPAALPDWLPDVTLIDLRLGRRRFDIRFWREGKETVFEVLKGKRDAVDRKAITPFRS
jgi:hypothetical protein